MAVGDGLYHLHSDGGQWSSSSDTAESAKPPAVGARSAPARAYKCKCTLIHVIVEPLIHKNSMSIRREYEEKRPRAELGPYTWGGTGLNRVWGCRPFAPAWLEMAEPLSGALSVPSA
jgi:hypothetical protein